MRGLLVALLLSMPAVALGATAKVPFSGTYTTSIAGKKPAGLNGTWLISIGASGRYEIYKSGRRLVTGSIRTTGARAIFVDQTGRSACPPARTVGVYRWKRVGRRLTLTPLSELCRGRRVVLSTHPLLRL